MNILVRVKSCQTLAIMRHNVCSTFKQQRCPRTSIVLAFRDPKYAQLSPVQKCCKIEMAFQKKLGKKHSQDSVSESRFRKAKSIEPFVSTPDEHIGGSRVLSQAVTIIRHKHFDIKCAALPNDNSVLAPLLRLLFAI